MIRLIQIAFALFLAACSTTPVSTSSANAVAAAKWSERKDGYGTLIVKRDTGFMGAACKASVYVDGERIASLGPGDKVTVYLPPGEHITGAKNGGVCGGAVSEAQLTLAANQQRTYRIAILDAGGIAIQPTAF
jgi:hypothetical protein